MVIAPVGARSPRIGCEAHSRPPQDLREGRLAVDGIRGRRRTAAAAGRYLRPGIYRPISETLWARRGAHLPEHLLRTKAGSSLRCEGESVPYRVFRLLAGVFVVSGSRRGRTADIVVASFDGGIVVLDQVGGRVYRTYGPGRVTRADERRRRIFTDHVSAPQFWLRDGGAVVEEELIEGQYLGDMRCEERAELVTTLVEQFAALTAAYGSDTPSVTDRDLETLLHQVDVPASFAHAWESSSTDWFSVETPWIPTPREANAKNLVVRPDGRPAPIDLGDLQVDPYFIYPVGILIAAGNDGIRRFLAGGADYSFATLFEAADQCWGGTPDERRGLLLARIVYSAHKDSLVKGRVDQRVFAASLHRRWDEVREVFDGLAPGGVMAS